MIDIRGTERGERGPKTAAELFDTHLPALIAGNVALAHRTRGKYHVHVSGHGGGEWTIDLDADVPSCKRGIHGHAARSARVSVADLERSLHAKSPSETLYHLGAVGFFDQPMPTALTIGVDAIITGFLVELGGTHIQLDQVGNTPTLPGTNEHSFIQFSEKLRAVGLQDRALHPPLREYGLGDLGGAVSILTGGWFMVDRVRLLLNDLRADIDSTLAVSLDLDTITLDVLFVSNDPTLKGQDNAYLVWFFGAPVGWQDDAFPDVNITDFTLRLKLIPYVNATGGLSLADIGVEFLGNVHVDLAFEFITDRVKAGITDAFATTLNTPEFRQGIAGALQNMIKLFAGTSISRFVSLQIDASGLVVRFLP